MWTRLCIFAFVVGITTLACSAAEKGESCEDENRIGGDCAEGLLCARETNDQTSRLICLKPCVEDAECESNEVCSGDRGINHTACRPR